MTKKHTAKKVRHPAANHLYMSITSAQTLLPTVNTVSMFDPAFSEPAHSPIDQFISNTNVLNLTYLNADPLTRELGQLVVLGYMSAVESYFRAVYRGLINIDEHCQVTVEERLVTFGAAIHHKKDVLPEALLEEFSFAGKKSIKDSLRDVIGIKGHLPLDIEKALDNFEKICQMRHCCVHRFGKLGAKNAIKLGLKSHSTILEKPLTLSKTALEDIAVSLRTFAKVINNFIFYNVLDRSARHDKDVAYAEEWSWDFRKDRRRFMDYYTLFRSELDAIPSPAPKDIYKSFRQRHQLRE